MFCPNCGSQIPDGAKFCTNCGSAIGAAQPAPAPATAPQQPAAQPAQSAAQSSATDPWAAAGKDKTVALLLAIFAGGFGVDRFYAGYTTLGIIKLLTAGGLGVWAIIDIVFILTGKYVPFQADTVQAAPQGDAPQGAASQTPAAPGEKTKTTASLIAFFVGTLGVMDFYAGNTKRGVIKLILSLTGIGSIGAAVMNIIDMFGISSEKYVDVNGKPFTGPNNVAKPLAIVAAVTNSMAALGVVIAIISLALIPLFAGSASSAASDYAKTYVGGSNYVNTVATQVENYAAEKYEPSRQHSSGVKGSISSHCKAVFGSPCLAIEHNFSQDFVQISTQKFYADALASRYSCWELRILRNAPYARNGFDFQSQDLKRFYSRFFWYEPSYGNVESKLSSTERHNIREIKKAENMCYN